MGDKPSIELPGPLAPETLAAQAMDEIDPTCGGPCASASASRTRQIGTDGVAIHDWAQAADDLGFDHIVMLPRSLKILSASRLDSSRAIRSRHPLIRLPRLMRVFGSEIVQPPSYHRRQVSGAEFSCAAGTPLAVRCSSTHLEPG
jgi:hypothetical protein